MITKNYIKMCEQAEEIQKVWRKPFKNYLGDLFWKGKEYLMIPEACSFVTEIMFEPKDEYIWIPTLEWLFEEIRNIYTHKDYYVPLKLGMGTCLRDLSLDRDIEELPIKEIALEYLMREKYGKIWTGEKWVKADD